MISKETATRVARHARRRDAERHRQEGAAGWLHGGGKNRHGAEDRSADENVFTTKYVASFVGFAPVNNPAVVIIVVIDEPGGAYHGGDVAAPVFRQIAEQILPRWA